MCPQYQAPINLSIQIQEDLIASSANGNLGALAAGPVASLPSLSAINKQDSFQLTVPAGSVMFYGIAANVNGVLPPEQYSILIVDDTGFTPPSFTPYLSPAAGTSSLDDSGVGNLLSTYDNGDAGVGATLTLDPSILPFTADGGYVVNDGDLVLVIAQDDTAQNGFYRYDLVDGLLTRDVNFDSPDNMLTGTYTTVPTLGDESNVTSMLVGDSIGVVGEDPVLFSSIEYPQTLIGPQPLTISPISVISPKGVTISDYQLIVVPTAATNQTPTFGGSAISLWLYFVSTNT